MKLFVVINQQNNTEKLTIIKEAIEILKNNLKAEINVGEEARLLLDDEEFSLFKEDEADYIVSIGGDACVLKAARIAIKYCKPLIGINAGRLGYLCAYKASELPFLNKESFFDLKESHRILIKVQTGDQCYYAINDVVIGKSNFGKSIDVNVYLEDKFVASWRGDGLIVATPTGSTAYNQSAGGPILRYDADNFVITPICPHFSSYKPLVVSSNNVIKIEAHESFDNSPTVYIDGMKLMVLDGMLTVEKEQEQLILCMK